MAFSTYVHDSNDAFSLLNSYLNSFISISSSALSYYLAFRPNCEIASKYVSRSQKQIGCAGHSTRDMFQTLVPGIIAAYMRIFRSRICGISKLVAN